MNYYSKYLKYKKKYLELKAGCANCESVNINDNEYIIHKDKILGNGVDGSVYIAERDGIPIVVKVMDNFETDKELKEFININKIMDNLNMGPKIYDIEVKDRLIYIFMEKMDYDLNEYINKKIKNGESMELIKKEIKKLVAPIHEKMKRHNITVGDKTIDNYMFKDGILKKIDFTQSKIKERLNNRDLKSYGFIHMYNPDTSSIERIILL